MDLDQLVELITKEILKRIGGVKQKSVLALEGCPSGIISEEYEVKNDKDGGYGYVLMTAEAYQALCRKDTVVCEAPVQTAPSAEVCESPKDEEAPKGTFIDLSHKRLLHERDLRDNNARRGDSIKVSRRTIITALAHDYAKSIGIKIIPG